MNNPSVPKSTWLTQQAVVVSDIEGVHRMYSQLTTRYKWRVIESTPTLEQGLSTLHKGAASLLIIDDSMASPSSFHCRNLFADLRALTTPVLVFLMPQRSNEAPSLSKMGFEVVPKPVTPAAFHQQFTSLLQHWEKPSFSTLRRLGYLLNRITDEQLVGALLKLMNDPSIQRICAQMLALHYRKAGKLREAEQTLLTSIKQDPSQDGRLLGLLDIYLRAAMPKMAEQILSSIRKSQGIPRLYLPDLIQSQIMLGQLNSAIDSLGTIVKGDTPDPLSIDFYARLLFAAGRDDEAEPLLVRSGRSFKKFQSHWFAAEGTSLPAAG